MDADTILRSNKNRYWRKLIRRRRKQKRQILLKGLLLRAFKIRNFLLGPNWTVGHFFNNPYNAPVTDTKYSPYNNEEEAFRKVVEVINERAAQDIKRKKRKIDKKRKKKGFRPRDAILEMIAKKTFKFPKIPLFIKHILPFFRRFEFKFAFEFDFTKRIFRIYKKPQFFKQNYVNLKNYLPIVKKQLRQRISDAISLRTPLFKIRKPKTGLRLSKIKHILNFEIFLHNLLEVKDKLQNIKLTKKELENIANYSSRRLTAFFSFHTVKRNIE